MSYKKLYHLNIKLNDQSSEVEDYSVVILK